MDFLPPGGVLLSFALCGMGPWTLTDALSSAGNCPSPPLQGRGRGWPALALYRHICPFVQKLRVCLHVHAGDMQALGSVRAVNQGVTELVLGGETPLMDCCLGGVSLSS